ncbi:hypothetical protein [Paenibacillus sp. Z6-24]
MVPIKRPGAMIENISARMNQSKLTIAGVSGPENFLWALNAVIVLHSLNALETVVNRLKVIEEIGGDYDDIVEALEDLGEIASVR